MKLIEEMLVFVEENCLPCDRVLETVKTLSQMEIVSKVRIFNRNIDPYTCQQFGVLIFPAVFINGRLAFYGEFSVEDAKRFVNHSVHQ